MRACISKVNRLKIEEKKLAFASSRSKYCQKLADLLIKLRSNTLSETEFLEQISFDEVVQAHDESYVSKDKINLLDIALNHGCHLMDDHTTPDLIYCPPNTVTTKNAYFYCTLVMN